MKKIKKNKMICPVCNGTGWVEAKHIISSITRRKARLMRLRGLSFRAIGKKLGYGAGSIKSMIEAKIL